MFLRRLTLAALVLLAWPALAQEPAAAPMTVSYLRGEATSRATGENPVALVEGALLHEGDHLETGPQARLEIALGTGSVLRLGPQSRLELRAVGEKGGAFTARLTLGNLWAKVQKLIGGQHFKIETQNGVAGVRGTEFRVVAAQSGRELVRVYEGVVEVKGVDGKWTYAVKPGGEIRYSHGAVLGPRQFDAGHERSAFMRWVRKKGLEASPHTTGEHHEPARKNHEKAPHKK